MKVLKEKRCVITVLMCCLFAITVLSSGCAKESPKTEKVEKINVTYVKAPLNVPSIIEKNQQLFEKEFGKDGIQVNFPEITSGSKQTEAVAAGELDFCNAVGGTSVILAAANGVDIKIISTYSRAPKAFMIVTKSPDINSIKDLKGKKIAGTKGTVIHQLLMTALEKNGMKSDDIQHIVMDIPGAVAALLNGSVDAALVAGGDATRALNAGAKVITTGEGLVDGTSFVAVRGDFLKSYPGLVKRFKQVHRASLEYMQNNPEEAFRISAEEIGAPIDEVKKMYQWYDFDPQVRPSDIVELKNTQDFLYKNGMLTKTINIEDLIVNIE